MRLHPLLWFPKLLLQLLHLLFQLPNSLVRIRMLVFSRIVHHRAPLGIVKL